MKKFVFVLLLLAMACRKDDGSSDKPLYRLVDHLKEVEFVRSPLQDYVKSAGDFRESSLLTDILSRDWIEGQPLHPHNVKLTRPRGLNQRSGLRTANAVLAPPETVFRFSRRIGPGAVLDFGYVVANKSWEDFAGGIRFEIDASGENLFSAVLKPGSVEKDRLWFDERIDLSRFSGRKVVFTFRTSHTKDVKSESILSAWVNPVITEKSELKGKNLLLISVDTLRADHLGCYGYPRDTSPNIDRIAKEGVLFDAAMAHAPYTMASHMAILTSLHPSFHGVVRLEESTLDPDISTLSEILYNQGYRTVGITGGGQLSSSYGFAEGFEVYDFKNNQEKKLDESIAHLEKIKGKNFFLFFHSFRPHSPYTPKAPYDTMFDPDYRGTMDGSMEKINAINSGELRPDARDLQHMVSLYDGEIRQTDEMLGNLFAYLRKEGLLDRTLIIFTSDHGEEFGEHGMVGVHSHTLFDELLHVPLIFRLPESLPAGKTVSRQVRSIDILPTILELMDVKFPGRQFQGVSLMPLISGKTEGFPQYTFSERPDIYYLRSVRTADYKFIYAENRSGSARESYYYDLHDDPREQKSLPLTIDQESKFRQRMNFLSEGEQQTLRKNLKRPELDEETRETLRDLGYINE